MKIGPVPDLQELPYRRHLFVSAPHSTHLDPKFTRLSYACLIIIPCTLILSLQITYSLIPNTYVSLIGPLGLLDLYLFIEVMSARPSSTTSTSPRSLHTMFICTHGPTTMTNPSLCPLRQCEPFLAA